MQGCFIHGQAFYAPSSTHSNNETHSDCVQIQGGTGHVFVGNTILAFADMDISVDTLGLLGPQDQVNAAFMIEPNISAVGNLTITDTWIDGGQYSINCANGPSYNIGDMGVLQRNKFGRSQV